MGKVITMYQQKVEESPILPLLREMDRKRAAKVIAEYEKKQALIRKAKSKQS